MNTNPQRKDLIHNFTVNILDGGFFGFAMGFASFSTILPLFVSQMTDSAVLIGLIPAIHSMGWQLPQLFLASWIARLRRLKPYVLWTTIHERLPFLGLLFIAWFLPGMNATLAIVLTYLMLVWQGLGAGITANGWTNLIGKVIPSDIRGTFFGMQSAAANLLASVGALGAGFILEAVEGPRGFAYCFGLTAVMMVISWIFISTTREPEKQVNTIATPENINLWKNVGQILKSDRPFLGFLISRMLLQFGMMASAFYMVYAVNIHHMDASTIGIMTGILFLTQVIANPVLGYVADHWSHKGVLEIGGIAAMLAAVLAWLLPDARWFALVMILNGISSVTFWTVGLAYSLEFGDDLTRPTYVGMANTLIAPCAILAPLLGGWIVDAAGYPAMFITAGAIALGTIFIFQFIKSPAK
ncbi:MAG TPA: MFS transporter [Longilinea sp.]|nr:MFS transporter [Longilinea sp.]